MKERWFGGPRKAGSLLMAGSLYAMFYYAWIVQTTDWLTVTGVFFLPHIFLLGAAIIFNPRLWTRHRDLRSRPASDKTLAAIVILGLVLGVLVEIPVFARLH